MSPHLLLAHWRDRWDKPTAERQRVPYIYGKVKRWSDQFSQAPLWSRTTLWTALGLLGLMLTALLLSVRMALPGQIAASAALLGAAWFARRYGGLLATLLLLWLSLCVTGRYLLWRFGDTLGSPATADYLFAFTLCAAELYLSLKVAVTIGRALWPSTRPIAALPTERTAWPDVDVLITCAGQSTEAVAAAARAALALEWPRRRLHIHLLDQAVRPDIGDLAAELAIGYLVDPAASERSEDHVNYALGHSKGALVLVTGCAASVPAGLLTSMAGAFLHSPGLAMLQSPHHFLAPPPLPAALALFAPQQLSFALLRRSALDQAGGIEAPVTSWQLPIAATLRALGFACCYAGLPAGQDGQANAGAAPSPVRLDRPFNPLVLFGQRLLARLDTVLRFYYLAPRLVFWSAPLLFLLAGVTLIDAPADMLAAFLVPHLLHGHIAVARMRTTSRLTITAELVETLLAWYLLLPSALNVLRGAWTRAWRPTPPALRPTSYRPAFQASHGLLVLLHVAALGAAAGSLGAAAAPGHTLIVLTMLWCLYHLLLLLAMLGVSEEVRQIGVHTRRQAARPAMLGLPLGRTLSCTTLNFPDPELALSLPTPSPLRPGEPVRIAMFEGHNECSLTARVLAQDGKLLRIAIDAQQHDAYREFGAHALARGPDWPAWLPGSTADRPIPAWVYAPLLAALIAVLDAATHGRYMQWLRIDHWIKLQKKIRKNDNEQAN